MELLNTYDSLLEKTVCMLVKTICGLGLAGAFIGAGWAFYESLVEKPKRGFICKFVVTVVCTVSAGIMGFVAGATSPIWVPFLAFVMFMFLNYPHNGCGR